MLLTYKRTYVFMKLACLRIKFNSSAFPSHFLGNIGLFFFSLLRRGVLRAILSMDI